jgi:DNA-binding LytR/AlgR family response regulator
VNDVKIAICDDNRLELQKIKSTVDEFVVLKRNETEVKVNAFSSGDDLLCFIDKHGGFDVLILDIIMPGMNGIELASEIRRKHDNCKIIFLTSSPEFAVDSYKVNAFYYLLKSHIDPDLCFLLSRAYNEMKDESGSSIIVKEKGKFTRIQIQKIKYLESINHTVNFHLRSGETVCCYSTMNDYNDVLLPDNRFVSCHKSFIVNMDYVISISSKSFILEGDVFVPISRQAHQQVKAAYFDYVFSKGNESIL